MSDPTSSPITLRLQRLGTASWAVLGIIALLVVVTLGLGAISGILVPLVIAVIFGSLLEPLVVWLERRGVRHVPAAAISLLVALIGTILTAVIVVRGFLEQLPQIYRQLMAGWNSFLVWGRSLDLDVVVLEQIRSNVERSLPDVAKGVLGVVSGTFSGAVAFSLGTFFAFFLLFFMLRDLNLFPNWLARITKSDPVVLTEVAVSVKESLRGYFRGIAITSVVTAPIFMVPLLLLRVPLAVPIFILYFVLSFIPFLGAWITGAFAVLIAFGSGGASAAAIIGVTFLISNGTIQSAVSSWALGSALRIHPVVVLLATMIGGTIAGLIGMILAAPLLAATIKSVGILKKSGDAVAPEGASTG